MKLKGKTSSNQQRSNFSQSYGNVLRKSICHSTLQLLDMSEYLSVEYRVLKRATSTLFNGFRSAHQSLCRAFFSKDLITREIEHLCNDNKVDRDTFLHAMVTTLQDRVMSDPCAYYTIIDTLKDETGLTYMVEILERLMLVEKEKMKEAEKKSMEAKQFVSVTSNYVTYTAEERNATVFAAARDGAMESVYTTPQLVSFRGQKTVSCTEGGDTLFLSASGHENFPVDKTDGNTIMKPKCKSSDFQVKELEGRTRGPPAPTAEEYQRMSESKPNYRTQDIRVCQSNEIGTSGLLENIGGHEMWREMQHDGRCEERKESAGRESEREAWAEESRRSRIKSMGLVIPNNIHGCSKSVIRDNSDIFEPHITSTTCLLESPITPSETKRNACRKCQSFRMRIKKLEEGVDEKLWLIQSWEEAYQKQSQHFGYQIEIHQRLLYEKEEETAGMHMDHDTRHQEILSLTNDLKSKLKNVTEQMRMDKESEIVKKRIFEHEKQREMQKLTKELQKLRKDKDRAEKEKELANIELDQTKKELVQVEKELDQAEKEKHDTKSLQLKKQLLHIGRELKRAKSLQCAEDLTECCSLLDVNGSQQTNASRYPHQQ